MKTTKSTVILLILTLLTASPLRSTERAEEISDTWKASCLVRISSDPAFLPLDFELLDALLHSSGVGGRAVRDVLGVSPDRVHDLIQVEAVQYLDSATFQPTRSRGQTPPSEAGMEGYLDMMYEDSMGSDESSAPSSSAPTVKPKASSSYSSRSSSSRSPYSSSSRRTRTSSSAASSTRTSSSASSRTEPPISPSFATEKAILIRLAVEIGEGVAKPAAEELLDAVIDNLQSSLLKAYEDYRSRLILHLQFADQEAFQTEKDLRDGQDRLRAISGSRVLDRNVILRDISELRDKIERLKMEQASEQVILELTAQQIAEIEAKTGKQIADDDITKELANLLAVQEANLQRVEQLHKTGSVSMAELVDARAKLARSRIELAQRREQLNKSAGGNLIESLNANLAASSIQTAQARAYLSSYEQQFVEAEDLLKKADDYELLSLKAEIAKQNLRDALVWRGGISRLVRMLRPPSVSVLGGE